LLKQSFKIVDKIAIAFAGVVCAAVKYFMQVGGGGSDQICSENERGSDHMHTGTGEMARGLFSIVLCKHQV